ncbi:MAG: metal ABC transporter solute-binding protein, Zn/Mn family [Candidatus Sumerlaeaceae bacterium]
MSKIRHHSCAYGRFWHSCVAWLFVIVAVMLATPAAALATGDTPTTASLARLCPLAAGNSWLASCLSDLGIPPACIERIVPPGTCPGHFDIRPSQAQQLRAVRLAVFFDFQSQLAQRLHDTALSSTPIIISPGSGLCIPQTYFEAAETLARRLAEAEPETSPALSQQLAALSHTVDALAHELRKKVVESRWNGAPVVSSRHQREFCQWLGLRVVATLPAADTASPAAVEKVFAAVRAHHAAGVIANLQEGTQAARAIASASGLPLVVFSNFPELSAKEPNFTALVRRNVENLLATSPAGTGGRK